ncbi:LysR family transcriptional regulator [Pseudonocardia xinjiangensis]|uniref:LysR family transcriptional regulator n=1 Tax=Pseudonocardia xinjiangensis TaxID=75289 RepID=UPI003D928D44
MEIRQLRYFVAVAEELHFGRAAERLAVVQPAVSQQVGRLERELGVRLLARSSRRVALTGDGERLLVEARSVLAAVERVRAVAGELAEGRAGTLRVGTSPGLGERVRRGVARIRAHTPERSTDAALHDAVLAASRLAGIAPRLGRPVRSVEDAVVEIGLGDRAAVVVLGCAGDVTPGVVVRPLDPPVKVPGHLLVARSGGQDCLGALVSAFA